MYKITFILPDDNSLTVDVNSTPSKGDIVFLPKPLNNVALRVCAVHHHIMSVAVTELCATIRVILELP